MKQRQTKPANPNSALKALITFQFRLKFHLFPVVDLAAAFLAPKHPAAA